MKARDRQRPPRVLSASEAVQLIPPGAAVAIQGSGGGVGEPTALLRALRARFDATAQPAGLTLIHATGLGDKDSIGTDLLAHPDLVRCDIAGHLGMAPRMAELIRSNQVACYNFPQGVISQMFASIAGRRPGVFTKVGLGTYIDPRVEAGRMNARADRDLVRVVELEGEEWLFFPAWTIDVSLVRGSCADTLGNIACDDEAAILEGIKIAQAAHASGGIVIAQVKHLAQPGTLDPRRVRIPGVSVDYLVVDPGQKQTCLHEHHPGFTGAVRWPLERIAPLPLDVRKAIARRAAAELKPGAVVNLGVGMPDGVASVASETGLIDRITFTVEQGIVGGMPAGGVIFGVCHNPQAILAQNDQFDFYDGGGLDIAFLGMAQTDRDGNVNVSKCGDLLAGCGGFINISQNARTVVFCGTFTAKGLACRVGEGRLHIDREGEIRKFVSQVEQITFSGRLAARSGRRVLYVTERAVFRLGAEGLELIEIAPGVDLQRDILGRMDVPPVVRSAPALMSPEHFM